MTVALHSRTPFALFALALAWLPLSCGGTSKQVRRSPELDTLARTGYRVAVMPFAVSASSDDVIVESLAPLGALLELEGVRDEAPPLERAGTVMRRAVAAHLAQGEYAIVELWVTDTQLAHAGISADEARDPANVRRVAETLSVQGVLYGDVTRWNRNYLVVESTQAVELELRLIDAQTQEELFFTRHEESRAEGVTGGPTGQISALTAPIAGLTGSTLVKLAREVAYASAQDLTGVDLTDRLSLEAARGNVPRLSFASIVVEGDSSTFVMGESLRVVAVGTAGQDVRFRLGRYLVDVPLEQVAVTRDPRGDRATYVGTYVVQEPEVINDLPVVVTIRSPKGHLRSSLRITMPEHVTIGGRSGASVATN